LLPSSESRVDSLSCFPLTAHALLHSCIPLHSCRHLPTNMLYTPPPPHTPVDNCLILPLLTPHLSPTLGTRPTGASRPSLESPLHGCLLLHRYTRPQLEHLHVSNTKTTPVPL
jgi:hypothetical protein